MKRVVVWIAIALIAALFASKLDSVLVYSSTAMLPHEAESYKAKILIEKTFPNLQNRITMLVIMKANVTSPKAVKWYERWKNATGVNASSFYDAWKAIKKALNGIYKGMGNMVKGINKAYAGYWMVTDMVHLTMTLNGLYNETEKQALTDFQLLTAGTELSKFTNVAKALWEYVHKKKVDPNSLDESVLSCIAKHQLWAKLSNKYARDYLCCLACSMNPKLKGVKLWLDYGFDPGTLRSKIESYIKKYTPEGIRCFVNRDFSKKLPSDVVYKVIMASWKGEKLENLDGLALEALIKKVGKLFHYMMVSKDWKAVNIILRNASYSEALKAKEEALRIGKGLVKEAYLLGGSVIDKEMRKANVEDAERVQELSHVLVLLVLFVLTRSVVASLVPFLVVGIGIVTGMALAYFIGQAIPIYQIAKTLMITTGLGLGMDYSIFILSRFKEELSKGKDPHEASRIAAKRAGHAVGISALAASLGFASLMLSGTLMLNSMGLTIPLTVLATAAASITMLPELLALLGSKRWFWWPGGKGKRPSHDVSAPRGSVVLAIFFVTLIVTVATVYLYVNYKGSNDSRLFIPRGTETYKALQAFSKEFPPGAWGPVMIYMNYYSDFCWSYVKHQGLEKLKGVAAVVDPSEEMGTLKGIKAVGMVILNYQPFSSKALELVPKIREVIKKYGRTCNAYVGGMPAELYDEKVLITKAFWERVAPFAVLATMVVLALAVRRLGPVISAAYGLVAAISWAVLLSHLISVSLWGYALYWITPLIALIATLGIGTDYNVFYITRMVEELEEALKRGEGTANAIWRPVKAVGPVIFGLASIMASAYFGMIIARSIGLRQMGLALGFSALFAALNAILLNPITISALAVIKEHISSFSKKEDEEIIE